MNDHEEINDQLVEHYAPLLHYHLRRLYPGAPQLLRVGAALSLNTAQLNALVLNLQELYADAYAGGLSHASHHVRIPHDLVSTLAGIERAGYLPLHTMERPGGPGLDQLQLEAPGVAAGIAQTLAKRLKNAEDQTEVAEVLAHPFQSEVVAMTEAARAQIAASQDAYLRAGVIRFDWVTDGDPCPLCAEMEATNSHVLGSQAPPLHPNCRCSITPATEN